MLKAKCACGAVYQVPDEKAGRTFKCRKCGGALKAPASSTGIDNNDFLSALEGLEQGGQEEPVVRSMTRQEVKSRSQEAKTADFGAPPARPSPRRQIPSFIWNFFVHPAGICCLLAAALVWNVAGQDLAGPFEIMGKVQRYGADRAVHYAAWFGWGTLLCGGLIVLASLSQGGEMHDMERNERWWAIATLVPQGLGVLWLLILAMGASPGGLASPVEVGATVLFMVYTFAFLIQVRLQPDRMMALGCRLIPGFAFLVALTDRGVFRHSSLATLGMAAIVIGTVYSDVSHNAVPAATIAPPVVQAQIPVPSSSDADLRLPSVCQTLPNATVNMTHEQQAGLAPFVAEGDFEFRPPLGFDRHAHPDRLDAARWEQPGVGLGENTLVFASRKRLADEDPNNSVWMADNVLFIRTNSIDRQYKAADYEFDQVAHDGIRFVRVRPKGPPEQGEKLGYRVYVAFTRSYVIVIQASALDGSVDAMQKLEDSVLTLRPIE